VRRRIEDGEAAVESTTIPAFYMPLSVELDVEVTGRAARVTLRRCEVDVESFLVSQRPAAARKKAEAEQVRWAAREVELEAWLVRENSWHKFIDSWAVDGDYGRRVDADDKPIFEPDWLSVRRSRSKGEAEPLAFTAELRYAEPGCYQVAARVTDVFGNDGIATVTCEVE
jgi:hypothetical protein